MSRLPFEKCEPIEYFMGKGERLREATLQSGGLFVFMQLYKDVDDLYTGSSPVKIRDNEELEDISLITFSLGEKEFVDDDPDPFVAVFRDGLWQPESPSELTIGGRPLKEGYFRNHTQIDELTRRVDAIFEQAWIGNKG